MNPITKFLIESNQSKDYRKRAEVIIVKNDKIFVGVRKGNKFMLPGGGIGPNEEPGDAAKREAVEELNINCCDLIKIGGPITITWPDIYGGEEQMNDKHKMWLDRHQLLGHINQTFVGKFSTISKSDTGPKDDKYPRKLITTQRYIDQLESDNKTAKLDWKIKWNNYTIVCLRKVQSIIDRQLNGE